MNRQEAVGIARQLAERFHKLPEISLPAYQGQSPAETALLDLRKQGAALVNLLTRDTKSSQLKQQLDKLQGSLQVAQLFNVVSDKEFDTDMKSINKIHDLIKARD
ncbi:MAG TPA: hypothetical protein VLG47_07010 [Candidatus Saccharimonadales bacterium]|nr:hypothetical protein [Candidatus Saccharimonadales bacterium]